MKKCKQTKSLFFCLHVIWFYILIEKWPSDSQFYWNKLTIVCKLLAFNLIINITCD